MRGFRDHVCSADCGTPRAKTVSPILKRDAPLWISLAIALTIHGAAAAYFAIGPSTPGASPIQTAGVSLNLVETLIVESSEQPQPQKTVSDDVEVSSEE
jgi:hypothetical protein